MERQTRAAVRGRVAGLAGAAVCACMAFGCADGYDSPDGFDVGVRGQTLVTPDSLTFTVDVDQTQATVSWPKVTGASGYEVTMLNVDNPDSAYYVGNAQKQVVYDHYVVDGCTMTCDVQADSRYTFRLRVIGNTRYDNRDGQDVDTLFSTLVPSICTVPDGADLYTYLSEHPIDSLARAYASAHGLDSISEVAIDLEPGGHYTMSGPVDFRGYDMTLRGSKRAAAHIALSGRAGFRTYGGLKAKYLRIDMTGATSDALVAMSSDSLPDAIRSQNYGFSRNGAAINGIYVVMQSIYFADVWVKNLPHSLVGNGGVECAWWDLTVTDCIIQCNTTGGSHGIIGFDYASADGSKPGGRMIKNITLRNSTFYNVASGNSSTYFLRYGNQSNANVEKTFGNSTGLLKTCYISMIGVTFSRVYDGQKWFNNINGTGLTGLLTRCIFYDLYQPFRRSMEKGGNWSCRFNFFYNSTDATDTDYERKDSNGNTCASLYDPQFEGDITRELDLEKPNGGVNFRPGAYEVRSNGGGDPRWLY